MGGGKGGGADVARQEKGYQSGFSQYRPGADVMQVLGGRTDTNLAQGFLAGWQDAASQSAPAPKIEMPDFSGVFEAPQQPQVDYAAQLAAQEEARRIAEGTAARDKLFSSYMDAAGTATDYVNSEINREMSNAKLLGIDYAIDDEMKGQRISDYFATIWGEGEQSQLEGYIRDFGNPTGFTGFSITRGDGSKYAKRPGSETQESVSGGIKPTLATEEEEVLGGPATVLGG
jgi:hypothetical protein